MIRTYSFATITTVGADGSAVGTDTSEHPINGNVHAIHVDYTNQPGTTDVTIATVHAPVTTIITLTDNATDGWFYPLLLNQGVDGADLTTIYSQFAINDYVKVSVAGADGAGGDETVKVTLLYEE